MKITSAEFLKSALKESDWPHDNVPEVAFLGRYNVGKSSLLNSLLGVRGLARTSSTPGRTQMLNFFLINNQFRFVDLPGYGYARAPKALQKDWGAAAEEFLAKREQLVLSIHIVDSRHEPSKLDLQLHEWLRHHRKPQLIVITKSDKLSRNELAQSVKRAARIFQDTDLITYSSTKRQGREQLWNAIEKSLKG